MQDEAPDGQPQDVGGGRPARNPRGGRGRDRRLTNPPGPEMGLPELMRR